MMLPWHPPAIIALAACLVVSMPAVGKLSTASFHSPTFMSSTDDQCTLPAVFIKQSIWPNRWIVSATPRATSLSCVALPINGSASKPRVRKNSTVAAAALVSTSVTATRAPSRARKCAIVPPIFGPAPKTIATLPSSRFMSDGRRHGLGLERHVLCQLRAAPLLGGAAVSQRLHLPPEDLAQQHNSGIRFAEPILHAVHHRSLTHHGHIVLRWRKLQRRIFRPFLLDEKLVVMVSWIVVAILFK